MPTSVLFDLGRAFGGVVRAVSRTFRSAIAPEADKPTTPATEQRVAPGVDVAAVAESVLKAGAALRAGFDRFAARTQPVYTTTLFAGASISGAAAGAAARTAMVPGSPSTLQTTAEVNTNASTVRTSSSAIGLDTVTPGASSALHSASALGLDVTSPESASTIQSTAELNTGYTTSYGSPSLTFTNGGQTSTSEGSLTGTYTGTGLAADATSLTFEITQGDEIGGGLLGLGEGDIDFRVKDQNGTVLFTYSGRLGTNEQVYLGADIGLTISFSDGDLMTGHTSSTTVTKTPITVDGDAAFNAGAGSRPNFDGGATVSAGSFTVNGTTITVVANDTINTVLGKINASGAGVTATLSNDTITLTTNDNSEDAIVLSNDTTGFLAATKLSGATTTLGNVRDDEQVLSKTSQFSSVTTGSFTINGVSISVDKDVDSISSIIDRINGSGAGVTASYNASTDKIELVTNADSESLIVVADDTTGLLTAVDLSSNNTVTGNVVDDVQELAGVGAFSGVVAGSFDINGVSIAVDPDADSVQDIVSRINASGAGVTAAYDDVSDTITVTPDVAGATLTIDNDTSGFLSAINLATGTTATVANADGAFNASGADGPLFDSGFSVVAGSFTVNGVTISVDADDTINSVVAKITASAAGVTATYDEVTESLTLTEDTVTGNAIVVGNDTSGFLAAVKLDGTAQSTTDPDQTAFEAALDEMAEYAAVSAGTLTVNGHDIAIDPATTTIDDLVSTLNGFDGVSASVDAVTGTLKVWAHPGADLTIADTSGIATVLGIGTGTHSGTIGATTTLETKSSALPSDSHGVAVSVSTAADQLNGALEQFAADRSRNPDARGEMTSALRDLVSSLERLGVEGLGVTADGDAPGLSVDRAALQRSLDALSDFRGTRIAVATTIDAFTAKTTGIAAEPVGGVPQEDRVRIQVAPLLQIDPAVAEARRAASRVAARTSAYGQEPRFSVGRDSGPYPTASSASNPLTWVPPSSKQLGLFDALFDDEMFK